METEQKIVKKLLIVYKVVKSLVGVAIINSQNWAESEGSQGSRFNREPNILRHEVDGPC